MCCVKPCGCSQHTPASTSGRESGIETAPAAVFATCASAAASWEAELKQRHLTALYWRTDDVCDRVACQGTRTALQCRIAELEELLSQQVRLNVNLARRLAAASECLGRAAERRGEA